MHITGRRIDPNAIPRFPPGAFQNTPRKPQAEIEIPNQASRERERADTHIAGRCIHPKTAAVT